MGYVNVGRMPDIRLPRSIFKMPKNHKTSYLHGDLVPIHAFYVGAGDTFDLKLSNIIRMSTPIVPFMDTIRHNVRAFFVPFRLIWPEFEEYVGANKGDNYQQNFPLLPATTNTYSPNTAPNIYQLARKLSYCLGKPLFNFLPTDANTIPVSVLKERAYFLIWNKNFRAAQLQSEFAIDLSSGTLNSGGYRRANVVISDNSNATIIWNHDLLKVNKMHDYFVDSTLGPQYGPSVTLPLGDFAPLKVDTTAHALGGSLKFGVGSGMPSGSFALGMKYASSGDVLGSVGIISGGNAPSNDITTTNLVADLTNATAATVNTLRYAFAVQRFSERNNFINNTYWSILAVHYGVDNPMARMQQPEYLGGLSYNINVNQVTSQSGYQSGVTTVLGEVGAVSVTARVKDHIFRKGFTEPGIVMVLAYTKHKRTYSQGFLREDLKTENMYDFLWPEFMNIGDQPTKCAEIYGASATPDAAFGYQEAWAEYKFFVDSVNGLLNPSIGSGNLGQWSLADNYANEPNLSSSWIQEDRDALTRVLKTGANGPDFIADYYFDYTASRIISLHKMPGLIDHVGLL